MEKIFKLKLQEQIIVQFLLLTWSAIVVIPFAIAFINSLKSSVGKVYRDPFGLPEKWQWDNYLSAWHEAHFGTYFFNSVVIAVSAVAIVVLLSSAASYVLARLPFRGSRIVFFCFLLGMIIPIRLAIAPLFVIVREMGLLDSLLGVILVESASMMPLAVFILTSFMKGISKEIEEAAMLDGALPFTIYWYVVLPLIRPALATVALLTFVMAWNEYFIPLVLLQSDDLFPLTKGITVFRSQFSIKWNMMFAGLLIMVLPTVLVFLLASRQFISGLTQGAVKE